MNLFASKTHHVVAVTIDAAAASAAVHRGRAFPVPMR